MIIALILMLCLFPISASPVAAQSVGDYFSISYQTEFSKTTIQGNESFYVTITGIATNKDELPLAVSKASITSRVIAEHQGSGARVTLNSSYTVTIDPFPSKKGEIAQSSVIVPLDFLMGARLASIV